MKPMMGRRNFRSIDGCAPSKDWITNFIRRWTRFLPFMEPYKGTSVDAGSILRAKTLIREQRLFDDDDDEEGAAAAATDTEGACGGFEAGGPSFGGEGADGAAFGAVEEELSAGAGGIGIAVQGLTGGVALSASAKRQQRVDTEDSEEGLCPLNAEKIGNIKGMGLRDSFDEDSDDMPPVPPKKSRLVRGLLTY